MYKKPIYVTRVDTCLASDRIMPYGDRISVSSESKKKEIALKLMSVYHEIEDEDEEEIYADGVTAEK